MTDAAFDALIAAVFPPPADDAPERARTSATRRRDTLAHLFHHAPTQRAIAGDRMGGLPGRRGVRRPLRPRPRHRPVRRRHRPRGAAADHRRPDPHQAGRVGAPDPRGGADPRARPTRPPKPAEAEVPAPGACRGHRAGACRATPHARPRHATSRAARRSGATAPGASPFAAGSDAGRHARAARCARELVRAVRTLRGGAGSTLGAAAGRVQPGPGSGRACGGADQAFGVVNEHGPQRWSGRATARLAVTSRDRDDRPRPGCRGAVATGPGRRLRRRRPLTARAGKVTVGSVVTSRTRWARSVDVDRTVARVPAMAVRSVREAITSRVAWAEPSRVISRSAARTSAAASVRSGASGRGAWAASCAPPAGGRPRGTSHVQGLLEPGGVLEAVDRAGGAARRRSAVCPRTSSWVRRPGVGDPRSGWRRSRGARARPIPPGRSPGATRGASRCSPARAAG